MAKKQDKNTIIVNVLLLTFRLATLAVVAYVSWRAYVFGFRQLFGGSTTFFIPFLVIWIVTAYIVLPRVHRLLSRLYVPDYFIGRTRTQDGFYGDPVNLAVLGSEKKLKEAMKKAGWYEADELNLRSTWKMITHSVRKKSYPTAPVSHLFLFSRKQDFAFQQEINGNPHARHHVRFWKSPDDWYLPGGFKADWIGAGTYDRRVGLSLFTLQITHKIGLDTDTERDYIIETLEGADTLSKVDMKKHFTEAFHSRNGGGDRIKTDGSLPFIHLK